MADERDKRIPVIEERARVGKRMVERGVVRISTSVEERRELITQTLQRERVEFERVPVNEVIETAPEIRQEGDVTVIPIIEEQVVVTKRLVLVEELRVKRRSVGQEVEIPVTLRMTEVAVERERSPSGERD